MTQSSRTTMETVTLEDLVSSCHSLHSKIDMSYIAPKDFFLIELWSCSNIKCSQHRVFLGHLSHSGDLLLWVDQTNLVCSNDDQGRVYQNCKFHDPWGRGSCARAWSYKSYSETALFQ